MRFEDLKQDLEGVTATAPEVHDTKISGRVQINASWVVGCDGTHSKVRKAAGIPFEGTPSNLTGMLADIQLTTKPQQIPLIAKGPGSGSMLAPIGDGLHFRFVGMADQNMYKLASEEVTLDQTQECMRDAFGSDFGAHSPLWLSLYGNAARVATSFREGRVFLAGDAAHQFFPAGGQGMNLGIQDATSLAWRLVMVSSGSVSGEASERMLSSYSLEHAAEVIVENVQAQTAIISANTLQMIAVRSLLSEALQAPKLNATWARRVCGFDEPTEPYRLSAVKGEPQSVFDVLEDPMLGQRVTHLKCGDQGDKYVNVGRPNKFELLLLGNGREEVKNVEIIEMARNCKDVEVSDITVNSRDSMWKDVSVVLVRPDMRIAWIARDNTPAEAKSIYFSIVLGWWFGV
jgi:hypothetical protein